MKDACDCAGTPPAGPRAVAGSVTRYITNRSGFSR
jgi:hypothetical protein